MKIFATALNTALVVGLLASVAGCTKTTNNNNNNNNGGGNTSTYPVITDSVYSPTDPSLAATIGFFGNGWQGRMFNVPSTTGGTVATATATDSLTINVNKVLVKVPPYLFGNNSNLWMGQVVTQPNLMQYIKDLSPNIIRGPGGSISDIYFWNGTDANPSPADAPANLLSSTGTSAAAGYWYGGNNASWTFSLDNYYSLLTQTNSTGIITINYGYARYGTGPTPVATAAHLAADWVRYDAGRTKFWEIGNETYGSWEAGYLIDPTQNHDGQPSTVTGALYGQHFNVFADSMRAAAQQIGATIYLGASLYQQPPPSYQFGAVATWNQGVLQNAGNAADFFIVHDYFGTLSGSSTVSQVLSSSPAEPDSVMSYIHQQLNASGVGLKPIALTEWNTQVTGSMENTSYIAGMHATKTLGALIKDQFGEASRWDLANGWANGDDMGMFNIGDEPSTPLWNPRPAFYYMYYFQRFCGDRMVYDTLRAVNGDLSTYSSTFSSGQAGTIIVNSGTETHVVSVDFQHFPAGSTYYWYVLTGGTDNASFSGQVFVNGTGPTSANGGPLNYSTLQAYSAPLKGTIKVTVPPLSVIFLVAASK